MWSGPRNLSTALMRSFAARGDTRVSDEPLYAHYLDQTGLPHPARDAVIASQSTSWEQVTRALTGPCDQPIWYQKHMAHHLLPRIERRWLTRVQNVLLLRHPRAVIASYARARRAADTAAHFGPDDLGLPQQAELYDWLVANGQRVWVLDSQDLLNDPPRVLERLCAALQIPWTPRMLSWPAGPHPDDGVWGPQWYRGVWSSTGFQAPSVVPTDVGEHEPLVRALAPAWERLSDLAGAFR